MPSTIAIVLAALLAVASKAVSFRFGAFRISVADTGGTPVHLSFVQARDAIEGALAKGVGEFRSGVIVVTVAPWGSPVTPPVTPL